MPSVSTQPPSTLDLNEGGGEAENVGELSNLIRILERDGTDEEIAYAVCEHCPQRDIAPLHFSTAWEGRVRKASGLGG